MAIQTNQPSLARTLQDITISDVVPFYTHTIWLRGEEYYRNGMVKSIEFDSPTQLTAQVRGSYVYQVVVSLIDSTVVSSCDCPYESNCKHQVATWKYLIDDFQNEIKEQVVNESNNALRNLSPDNLFASYLESISKEELISLVLQFAPDSFRKKIELHQATDSELINLFKRYSKKTFQVIAQNDFDMPYFAEKFNKSITPIIPLAGKIPFYINNFILKVIHDLGELNSDCELYDPDDYDYGDQSFDSEEFAELTINHLSLLPTEPKLFLHNKIYHLFKDMEYIVLESTFSSLFTIFNDADAPLLKKQFIDQILKDEAYEVQLFYNILEPNLTDDEKNNILSHIYLSDNSLTLKYVLLLIHEGKKQKAFDLLDSSIQKENNPFYFMFKQTPSGLRIWLDLGQELALGESKLKEMITQACTIDSSKEFLIYAQEYFPQHLDFLKQMVRTRNIFNLIDFLHSQSAYEEAHEIVMDYWHAYKTGHSPDTYVYQLINLFSYFANIKERFPEDSIAWFEEYIHLNSKEANNRYYTNIEAALSAISSLSQNRAKVLAAHLASKYYRRRNLVALLNKFLS